jgi:hypothetical protein
LYGDRCRQRAAIPYIREVEALESAYVFGQVGAAIVSILRQVQAELLSKDAELSKILLKVRFLASRLGSEPLEDWVKYETEGYPRDAEVPDYRIIGVTYSGTWAGPEKVFHAPIPAYLIEKYASETRTRRRVRQSIAGVERLAQTSEGKIEIDASNLILVLQDKVYKNCSCLSVSGEISVVAMTEIIQSVTSRVLELTIELEKRVPEAVEVTLEKPITHKQESEAVVTQIFNQTVYGNVTHVTATDNAQVSLAITAGDVSSMVSELVKAGLPPDAAKEFSEIVSTEKPESAEKPLGKKAMEWVKANAPKAAGGVWTIGSTALTSLLTEAALRYYGFKQ